MFLLRHCLVIPYLLLFLHTMHGQKENYDGPNGSILNSEFRFPYFEKESCVWKFFFFLEMPHQGPCTGLGKVSKIGTI